MAFPSLNYDGDFLVGSKRPSVKPSMGGITFPLATGAPPQTGAAGAQAGAGLGGVMTSPGAPATPPQIVDPRYQALQSGINAQNASALSQTQGGIRDLLISFGMIPEGYNDTLGAVDPTTRALAQQNTDSGISGYARGLEQKKDALKSLIARLSATGMRRSGTKGAKMRRQQLDFDRWLDDQVRALLGKAGEATNSYNNLVGANAASLASWIANNPDALVQPGTPAGSPTFTAYSPRDFGVFPTFGGGTVQPTAPSSPTFGGTGGGAVGGWRYE